MGNVYKPVDRHWRSTAEYLEAKSLFEQRRQAQLRVAEIDRMLREIAYLHSAAVQVARSDIPFRRPHGRPKPVNQPVPASAPAALSSDHA
jgi:hypothetical protein